METTQTTVLEPNAGAAPAASGVAESTPSVGVPSSAPSDAGLAEELKSLQSKLSKYETDINNLKSFSDKRLNEYQKQYQSTIEDLQKQLMEARLATMPEDQRNEYMAQMADQERAELYEQVNQAQQLKAEFEESQKAIAYFLQQGVPLNELVVDKGYEALYQSGFGFITNEYQKLKSSSQTKVPSLPPQAPPVDTGTGTPPPSGPTWADLEAKYGGREQVYRYVESGRLPASIIPV